MKYKLMANDISTCTTSYYNALREVGTTTVDPVLMTAMIKNKPSIAIWLQGIPVNQYWKAIKEAEAE